MNNAYYCIFLVGLILLGLGLALGIAISTNQSTGFVLLDRVELQEYLVGMGYDLKIDGKIGPKTIEAWDAYTGERHAAKIFKEAGKVNP